MYLLATPGEQVTDTAIDYIINNVLRGDANYDNYWIQNTGLQQINQFEKGNGKIILQPIHCGMRHWILGATAFGDDAIFDSMEMFSQILFVEHQYNYLNQMKVY